VQDLRIGRATVFEIAAMVGAVLSTIPTVTMFREKCACTKLFIQRKTPDFALCGVTLALMV